MHGAGWQQLSSIPALLSSELVCLMAAVVFHNSVQQDAFDFPSLAASRAAICIAQRWSMAVLNVQDDNYLIQAVEQLRKRTV